jgi:phosphoribosylaminoimidazolecarboxamide formyltransferase/IMP cyclohydrolase
MKKRALISVYDKQGIETLAASLVKLGWEILSTGGTAKYLTKQQIPVTDVQDATGFPECLDGRVKTLHPVIHAGLLAKRDEASHIETLEHHNIAPIDLICVNLYPFFEKVKTNLTQDEVLEFIDIGGTALLRSGAKNYQDVLVLTDPKDYDKAIAELQEGTPVLEFRKYLAAKVFNLTAAYDAAIAQYLVEEEYPAYLSLGFS